LSVLFIDYTNTATLVLVPLAAIALLLESVVFNMIVEFVFFVTALAKLSIAFTTSVLVCACEGSGVSSFLGACFCYGSSANKPYNDL
jgi:hypothetical protein